VPQPTMVVQLTIRGPTARVPWWKATIAKAVARLRGASSLPAVKVVDREHH